MWIVDALVIGIALSMDAFAVTIANAFAYPGASKAKSYMAPVAFAVFQGVMPVIGYFLGSFASDIILQNQGIVSLVVLGAIGGKMIYDGIKDMRHPDGEEDGAEGAANAPKRDLSVASILLQAVATSIDALAVGVAYASGVAPIGFVAIIITLTTLATCTVAWFIGRKFGEILGARAQVVGGIILVIIGLRNMFF